MIETIISKDALECVTDAAARLSSAMTMLF